MTHRCYAAWLFVGWKLTCTFFRGGRFWAFCGGFLGKTGGKTWFFDGEFVVDLW